MTGISRPGIRRGAAAAAAGVMMTSLLGATAGPAQAGPGARTRTCTVETLPAPANSYRTDTVAIDPTGRYILGDAIVRQETDSYPLLLWDRERLTQFTVPLPNSRGVDVNSSGVVIGNSQVDGQDLPWRYRNGVLTRLPLVSPADTTLATGINSRGDIVGSASTPGGRSYTVLWPANRPGTVRVLRTPPPYYFVSIADDRTIVGFSGSIDNPTSWMRTPAGRIHYLTGSSDSKWAWVMAASGHWAVGEADQGGELVILRWNLRTRVATVLDPRLGVAPTDVNGRGVTLAGDKLQRGGTVVTLPPPPGGWAAGRAIADNGTVVGFRNDKVVGGVRAVRWTGC